MFEYSHLFFMPRLTSRLSAVCVCVFFVANESCFLAFHLEILALFAYIWLLISRCCQQVFEVYKGFFLGKASDNDLCVCLAVSFHQPHL